MRANSKQIRELEEYFPSAPSEKKKRARVKRYEKVERKRRVERH